MKQCPKCNITHTKEGRFCSRSCANSKQHSEETKLKQSNSAKNSIKVLEANRLINNKRKLERPKINCIICNMEYSKQNSDKRATCGNSNCIKEHLSNTTGRIS